MHEAVRNGEKQGRDIVYLVSELISKKSLELRRPLSFSSSVLGLAVNTMVAKIKT